jgi:hypothetical protein
MCFHAKSAYYSPLGADEGTVVMAEEEVDGELEVVDELVVVPGGNVDPVVALNGDLQQPLTLMGLMISSSK